MAGIMLSCPTCNSLEWKLYELDERRFQCKNCEQWFDEDEIDFEFVEAVIE